MRGDYKLKLRSLLVAILMIASAMFVYIVVDKVEAAHPENAPQPGFLISSPANGEAVSGIVTITWNASWVKGADLGYRVGYNVSIGKQTTGGEFGRAYWIMSNSRGNSTSYTWDTRINDYPDGIYYINVTAITVENDTTVTHYWTNASGTQTPIKVEVRNNMHLVPGVTQFQGGNWTVFNNNYNYNHKGVISAVNVNSGNSTARNLIAGDGLDITINSSLWFASQLSSQKLYLCYPVYNGSEDDSNKYDLRWKRSSTESIVNSSDWVFDDIYLTDTGTAAGKPVAGLWIIDDCYGDWSDAIMTNASLVNSTVPAWFWVNSSTEWTVTPSATSWPYNSSGYITLDVENSAGGDVSSVIDIRRKENGTSIYDRNYYKGSPTEMYWYKNNSRSRTQYGEFEQGFWSVGNYTAYAYYDADYYGTDTDNGQTNYVESNMGNAAGSNWIHYNDTYGASSNKNGTDTWLSGKAERYNWSYCGPWDPPEYNATPVGIQVTRRAPDTSIPAANQTMYFDFGGEVNISINEPNGAHLSTANLSIFNPDGDNVTNQFYFITSSMPYRWANPRDGLGVIDLTNVSKGYIRINHSSWGKDTNGHPGADVTPWGTNGTYQVMIYADVAPQVGDRTRVGKQWTEEWNTTVDFTLATPEGRIIFTLVDDDGGLAGGPVDNTDGVIPRVPSSTQTPVNIYFKIENSQHRYLGQAYAGSSAATSQYKARKNITVSGDALFLENGAKTLEELPQGIVSYVTANNTWRVSLIPVMALNGGTITISVDWGNWGSHTETITIGGTHVNGTILEISPTEFTYGTNTTLTITVKHPTTGAPLTGGTVRLYWIKDDGSIGDKINQTTSPDTAGGNTYTFIFNTTQQSNWQYNASNGWTRVEAPRNITAYVDVTNVGTGFARAKMEAKKDLKVSVELDGVTIADNSNIEVMAGMRYTRWHFNVSIVGTNGTQRPNNENLKIRIFNSTGDDVTFLDTSFGSQTYLDGSARKNFTNAWMHIPGVYTVQAYNYTHKSWDTGNATITVVPVELTSDVNEFIWGVDKNISATFTLTYKGQPVNGTLRVDNISKTTATGGSYNKTWTNASWTPGYRGSAGSGSDTGGNTSISLTVTNGMVTLHNITAEVLDQQVADSNKGLETPSKRYITFHFRESSNDAWANVSGKIKVTIPMVTPTPASLPVNKPATLELLITGRGTGLENVFVDIQIPGVTGRTNGTTDATGVAIFSFTPLTTGSIVIRVENRTSDVTVPVTSWSLYLDVPATVNEGEVFTATVRNGTISGAGIAGAIVTFNKQTYTTGTDGTVQITAPSVTSDREYTIKATFTGHAEASDTITVVNVPVLVIVSPEKAYTGETFDVTIADDTGSSIVGAIITFNGKTYTSGANGIATLTAPSEKGNYNIDASKTGFADADTVVIKIEERPIPGFEVLALFVALGVSFILLRRRRQQ